MGDRPCAANVTYGRPVITHDGQLEGPRLLELEVITDDRGWFQETYRQSDLADLGISETFAQDNHSRSTRGVIRGMHFQAGGGCSETCPLCPGGDP